MLTMKDNVPKGPDVEFDPVSKPEHYAKGSLECIDWIRAALTPEEYRGYLKGCILKYFWRHEDKGKPVQDLQKLRQYASFLIDQIEREEIEKDILEENLRAAEWVQKRREEREEVTPCRNSTSDILGERATRTVSALAGYVTSSERKRR